MCQIWKDDVCLVASKLRITVHKSGWSFADGCMGGDLVKQLSRIFGSFGYSVHIVTGILLVWDPMLLPIYRLVDPDIAPNEDLLYGRHSCI